MSAHLRATSQIIIIRNMSNSRHLFGSLTDPVLIIGTVLSVLLGVLFYFRTDIGTAMGVFATLLGIAVTLQVQSLVTEQRRSSAETRTARMVSKIESVSWLPDRVEQIAEHVGNVVDNLPQSATSLAQQTVDDCLSRLTDLQRGHFNAVYGDQRLFLTLTAAVSDTMLATSAQEIDVEWWNSPRSEKYWEINLQALKRGVKVVRIFIYHDWTKSLADLAKKQADAGIEVYRVERGQLPPRLVADIVIWDRVCGYETQSNAAGQATRNFFTFAADDIDRLARDFEVVRTVASRLSGQQHAK